MTVICWFRRVLRLDDHPALIAAARAGQVIPLVILDPAEAEAHPASALRQTLSLPRLQTGLHSHRSRLIVRRGDPSTVLPAILRETGADAVHTTMGFPFASDHGLQTAVEEAGATLHLHPLADLTARGAVTTQQGTTYKVFTPFWNALRGHDIAPPQEAPSLPSPEVWPDSDGLDWPEARAAMSAGWDVVGSHIDPGEDAALDRLHAFLEDDVQDYRQHRDLPWDEHGTSNLSDALAVGEISARRIWHIGRDAMADGRKGADAFMREVAWREFARDLFHENPDMDKACWRTEWNDFPWKHDNRDAEAWRQGRTGIGMVDAGARELMVTGRMHNRVRLISGSYLCKHLMTDWKVGLDWFARTLIDWDAASNAMNWQWVAGCGPDASPYFRVFNPETQGDKFDGKRRYRSAWLDASSKGAQQFRETAPRKWAIDLSHRPDRPIVSVSDGRDAALTAYHKFKE